MSTTGYDASTLQGSYAIAIGDATKKNPQWVLTNQGSELSGCIYQ
ncbi:hypothetical protein [Nostoc sp. NMS4]|nr:hypothetical protein [Nostoc sp. NMS4]